MTCTLCTGLSSPKFMDSPNTWSHGSASECFFIWSLIKLDLLNMLQPCFVGYDLENGC